MYFFVLCILYLCLHENNISVPQGIMRVKFLLLQPCLHCMNLYLMNSTKYLPNSYMVLRKTLAALETQIGCSYTSFNLEILSF